MSLLKTNISGYKKDPSTNLVINTNNEYESYKQQKIKAKNMASTRHELTETKKELETIRTELAEIKDLFRQIVNGKQNV